MPSCCPSCYGHGGTALRLGRAYHAGLSLLLRPLHPGAVLCSCECPVLRFHLNVGCGAACTRVSNNSGLSVHCATSWFCTRVCPPISTRSRNHARRDADGNRRTRCGKEPSHPVSLRLSVYRSRSGLRFPPRAVAALGGVASRPVILGPGSGVGAGAVKRPQRLPQYIGFVWGGGARG